MLFSAMLRAVIFDLFKTLGDFRGRVSDEDICRFLQGRGYEAYPQAFHAAFGFVTFIDNPRTGFTNYPDMFEKAFERMGIAVDDETLSGVSRLYEDNPFELFPGSAIAVKRIRGLGLKTAIVTTPPRFWFESGIRPILQDIDYVCTSSEAECEKSNPKMYQKAIQALGVDPSDVVVIGDNVDLDVRLPKKLGMRAIHLSDEKTEADANARDVGEGAQIIERWIRDGSPGEYPGGSFKPR